VRVRPPAAASGDELPAELAAGPDHPYWQPAGRLGSEVLTAAEDREQRARKAWFIAGRDWSRSHGHDWNGWQNLLSDEIRYRTSSRYRLGLPYGPLTAPDPEPTPDPEPPAVRDASRTPKPPWRPDPPPSASFFKGRF
jgi:hypothetical protein